MEIRVVTLGLDGAGKTTILFKLKQDEFMQPIPTIGKCVYCFYLNEYFIGKNPNLQMSSQSLYTHLMWRLAVRHQHFRGKMQGSVTVGLTCGLRRDSKKEQNIGGTVGRNKESIDESG